MQLDIPQDIGAFLRAINALNNLNISVSYIDAALDTTDNADDNARTRNAQLAIVRMSDIIGFLTKGGPDEANYLGGKLNLFPSVVATVQSARSTMTPSSKFNPPT